MSLCVQTEGCGYINWCGYGYCEKDCALFNTALPIIKGYEYSGKRCYKVWPTGKSVNPKRAGIFGQSKSRRGWNPPAMVFMLWYD